MRISRPTRVLLLAFLGAGIAPAALLAQGVTVRSSTSIHASGALGPILRLAGQTSDETTTYVAGHKMRTDSRDRSTIVDVDAGRLTNVDHKQKTYDTMTFDQLAAAMQQAQDQMKAEQARQTPQAAAQKPQSDVEWHYDVATEATGQHRSIAGYDARQVLITVTVTANEKGKAAGPDQGALVALVDTWRSSDAPNSAAMMDFERAYASRMKREFNSQVKGLQAAFGADPRMKTALEAAGKEMAKAPGVSLKSTTSIIVVPVGMKFDRQLALGASDKSEAEAKASASEPKPKGGFFARMKAAAEQAQAQAQQSQSQNSSSATQTTLLSFTNEVQQIQKGVPADAFSVPAGYREVPNDLRRTH